MARPDFFSRRNVRKDLIPKSWLDGGVDPTKKSPQVVNNDRWDREDLSKMKQEVAEFEASRRALGDFATTGADAMDDMFFSLLKADPRIKDASEVRPSHLVNRKIMEEAQNLDEYDRLRRYSVNDDVQTALSCVTIEPDMETLFDHTEKQRKDAEKLQQAMQALQQAQQDQHDLDDVVRRWTEDQDNMRDGECQTCDGTGQVPKGGGEDQEGDGDGDGEGDGQEGAGEGQEGAGEAQEGAGGGQGSDGHGDGGTESCPDCAGTGAGTGDPQMGPQDGGGQGQGQPGGDRPDELTDEQRQQLNEFAKQQRELAEKVEQARQEAEQAGQNFEDSMDSVRATIRNGLANAFDKAADDAQTQADTALAWGLDPGTLQHMDAQERIEMARKLKSERFRRIADLFGPMRNMMLTEQRRRTTHTTEEIYDVEMGNDIGRMVPSELLSLGGDEYTELDFFRRYMENSILQYAMQGEEKLARGGIIICEDGSGSMSGERELWAKAVMLCLLHLARTQGRSFRLIHFGSPGQYRLIEFTEPSHFTMDRIMEAAELFFGGGPLRVDQRVATPDGWRKIGSVQVGDKVYGPDGLTTNVIGVYPQGELDLYRVTFSDGAEVICDGSHLWTVDTFSARGKWKTRTLDDLLDTGLWYEHEAGRQARFSVPVTAPVAYPEADLPLDPYLLGYMLGNGGFTHASPKITSAPGDETEWVKCLPDGITVNDGEKRDGFCPSYTLAAGTRGHKDANPVTEALRDLGLWGVSGNGKFIPEPYLFGSIDQRWDLLCGLCDSDGWIAKPGRVGYDTASEKLADQVVELARSLGCMASVKTVEPKRSNESTLHKVSIRVPTSLNAPFRLDRYTSKWEPRKQFVRSIVSAERVDTAEAICIKVDREDGLFLTEGYITTHNTDFSTPMRQALNCLQDDHAKTGEVRADVVFVTDDECYVDDAFMQEYLDEAKRMNFTTWGISVAGYGGGPREGALNSMTEGKVAQIKDLASGEDIRGIFRGV